MILIGIDAASENTGAILIRNDVAKGTDVILKSTGVAFERGAVYLRSI